MSQKKNSWPELGTITRNEVKDKAGNVVKNAKGEVQYRMGFKVAENVTILVDGKPVELNQYRSGILKSPLEEVEQLYKNGAIGDDKIEERREKAKDLHSWLRYKVVLPPTRQN